MPQISRMLLTAALAVTASAVNATNEPPATLWTRETLLGDLGGVRTRLTEHGISFIPTYTGEVIYGIMDSPHGSHVVYDHNVNLPLDVDMEKLLSWRGATFHANAYWLAGRSLTEDCIGDLANVSNISAYRTFRLQELWLQQTFWKDRASIKIGSVAVDTEFFAASSSALFINSSFGTFSLIAANLPNPPIYPVAAPAVRLAVQLHPRVNFQIGIFDGDSGAQDVNKNGADFHLAAGDGALIFSELGFNLHPATAGEKSLAGILKIGSFVHTKRITTWQNQLDGSTGGGSYNYGIYGVAEHDLFKRDGKRVTAFLRGGGAPGNRNVIGWYCDVGVNATGLLPGRTDDVAGIAFARSSFSRSFSDYQQTTEGTRAFDSEMVIEATYKAQITPWWMVQPDLQFILTPGGERNCDNAIVLGLRTSVSF